MNSGTGLASSFAPEGKKEIEEISAPSINGSSPSLLL